MPDEWATVNFGSGEKEAFQKLVEYQPDQPLMCMEFWNGWFDHWGGKHHTRPAEDVAAVFENMLSMGASVNFYMFHGGTNFGFYNGANCLEKYEPTITSYDYDTLLNEWGAPTDKFFAVQKVLSTYGHRDPLPLPEPVRPKRYGPVRMTEKGLLRDALPHISAPVSSTTPLPMEKYGQNYGFILYSTHVQGPRQAEKLIIQDVRDRALVFVNEEYAGVLERWGSDSSLTVHIPPEGATITLLVENMGRVNYGPHLRDPKGITEGVRLGNQFLYHWNVYPLPLTNLADLPFRSFSAAEEATSETPVTGRAEEGSCPTFYKGELQVDEPADTFVDLSGWTKGVVLVNGFNIGRYWSVGPQQTLYLPGPLLKEGRNEIVVFELHGVDVPDGQQLPQISLQDEHVLGPNHVQKADHPVGDPEL
jgi:beta-galactosidase